MDTLIQLLDYTLMGQSLRMWLSFLALILMLLVLDLGVVSRKSAVVTTSKSLKQSALYVVLAGIFGIWLWGHLGREEGIDYYTAYMIELSLSLDNLFVMSVILNHFKIPSQYQHRILFWGIIGVLFMRGLMIGSGLVIIEYFHWVLFIFAGLLIVTGLKMLLDHHQEEKEGEDPLKDSAILHFLEKHLRFIREISDQNFFVKRQNPKNNLLQTYATPLFMALVCIEIMDIVFAIDSVPAVFAITTAPFIVYSSNIFAILGLRSMYFAVVALLDRFKYMNYALAIVLIFIGGKIFYGEFVEKIDPLYSLAITIGLLLGGALFSLLKTRHSPAQN